MNTDYRPDIDGLRGVAVLTVLFYHAHLGFDGGYVGVDVFFVISGFLLTRILVKAVREGRFSYRSFWERRVRRLIPALLLVTLFTAASSYFLLLPEDLDDLGGALVAQPLLVSNVYFSKVVSDGYFGNHPETRPLLHTWSLGVEEQFYLFYPMLLVLVFRFAPKQLVPILATMSLLSLLATSVTSFTAPISAFFLLPTRAWELLLGGLVALAPPSGLPRWSKTFLGWLGLLLIVASSLLFSPARTLPAFVVVFPCVGAALAIWANRQQTSSGRLLTFPPLVWIGLLSYSLYLWHWPLMAYGAYFGLSESLMFRWSLIAVSIVLSYLSYRFVETPIRHRKWWPTPVAMIKMFLLYAAVSLVSGAVFLHQSGFPQNWKPHALKFTESRRQSVYQEERDVDLKNPAPPGLGAPGERVDFIVWGDSHARAQVPVLDELGREYGLHGLQLTHSGTPALKSFSGMKPWVEETWFELLKEYVKANPGTTVFLVSRWHNYVDEHFSSQLRQTITELDALGAKVVFVEEVPEQPAAPPRLAALATRFPWLSTPFASVESHRERTKAVAEALATLQKLPLERLDPAPLVFDWGTTVTPKVVLYADAHHLSIPGAMRLKSLYEPLFQRQKKETTF